MPLRRTDPVAEANEIMRTHTADKDNMCSRCRQFGVTVRAGCCTPVENAKAELRRHAAA